MSIRRYDTNTRNKLPRNKYGIINNNTVGDGTSVFGGTTGLNSSTLEGAAVISLDMIDIDSFRGATDSEAGTKGVVPAPGAGMNNWFYLRGSGDWDYIPAAKWLHEFPASEGLEKTGLELDGNFNVTNTIKTMNLEVQGSAHFFELVIEKIKAQGGQVIISPSLFHIDYVGEVVPYDIFDIGGADENSQVSPLIQLLDARTDIYNALVANGIRYIRCFRLYQRSDDGKNQIKNRCQIGDMMRCKSFNLKATDTVYKDISNTDYWSFVVNAGEGEYTNDDNETFDAIYIDLAFTLQNESGHNFPLGTILNLDGTYVYPAGYEEIQDAIELKKRSMEMWNGTTEVNPEFFENAEWKNIQKKVVDIRGIEDQIADLTGRANADEIGGSRKKVTGIEDAAEEAVHGNSSGTRSAGSLVIQTLGDYSNGSFSDEPQSTDERRQAEEITAATLGNAGEDVPAKAGLTIEKKVRSELVLEKNLITDRAFVAGADLYDGNTKVIDKGDVVPAGTTTKGDWKVIDYIDEDIATKTLVDEPVTTIITGDEKKEIDTFPEDTPKNVNRDPENYQKEQNKYSERTSWQFGYSGYYPDFVIKEGDDLVCLGHLYDDDRQNAIVLSACPPIDPDLNAPAIAQYSHLDTFGVSISKYRQTAIAANGNEFMGQFFINYNNTFVDVNDRINMMIMDVKSGLESVGIHLDGDNSTIKMVGSVELKQHDQMNGDTLSVFDSLGRKKVEIIPTTIPSRDDPSNPIEKTRKNFNAITDKKNAGPEYVSYTKDKKKEGFLSYSWEYVYILDKFNLKFTTSIDLGHMDVGNVLTLNGLNLHLLCNTYLCGSVLITNHGILPEQQDVSSLKYTLKVNGGYIRNPNNLNEILYKDIPITGYSIGGRNTGDINVTKQTLLSIGSIPYNGSYTLDITAEYYVHARAYVGTRYPDYYYSIECGINGYVNSNITRTQGNNNTDSVSRMTIGTNGMYFLGDKNYRYFYAGEDGYEMRWGNEIPGQTQGTIEVEETSLMIDSENGFRMLPLVKNVTGPAPIEPKYTMVICAPDVNGYTITLPDATEAGIGREITIIGFVNWTNPQAGTLKVQPATGDTIEFLGVSYSSYIEFKIEDNYPKMTMKFISTGSAWYVLSYC